MANWHWPHYSCSCYVCTCTAGPAACTLLLALVLLAKQQLICDVEVEFPGCCNIKGGSAISRKQRWPAIRAISSTNTSTEQHSGAPLI